MGTITIKQNCPPLKRAVEIAILLIENDVNLILVHAGRCYQGSW